MMNWKLDVPLQATFMFYSNQDILQITTFQCPLFTGGNCYWPKTTDHFTSRSIPWPCCHHLTRYLSCCCYRRPPPLCKSEPLTCTQFRESGRKSPTWTDFRKNHGLGGKTINNQQAWLSPLWDLSLLQDRNLCWHICKFRNVPVPHLTPGSCSHVPHL